MTFIVKVVYKEWYKGEKGYDLVDKTIGKIKAVTKDLALEKLKELNPEDFVERNPMREIMSESKFNIESVDDLKDLFKSSLKLSNNNELYIFQLRNLRNSLLNLTEKEKIEGSNKFFVLTEAMSVLWCTSLDNVVRDYMALCDFEK